MIRYRSYDMILCDMTWYDIFVNIPVTDFSLCFVCGPLPPPKAFSRGFFAGARVCCCSGRRRWCARAVPHVLARPQRRNLRRLSPQSTGLSCPLSVWTQCLDTEINYYRDSFGGVPSDLRSSGSVGGPAGAAVMRTGAGGCKVEIYDMFHTPGTHKPPTDFVAMTHNTYLQYFVYCSAQSRDFNARAGRVLATETTRAANSNDSVEAGCMAPRILLGSWTSVLWDARSTRGLQQLQLCCLIWSRTDGLRKYFGVLYAEKCVLQTGMFHAGVAPTPTSRQHFHTLFNLQISTLISRWKSLL